VGAVHVDAGHAEMRIGRRVSVTGEVFDRGQHPALMSALDIGRDQIADLLGIFTERARVDDGIGRVRIHVGVREKIPVNPDGACFERGDVAEILGVFDFAISPESHGVRENRGSLQAHRNPAFKIGGEQQRQLRIALQAVEKLGSFVGFAAQKKWTVHMDRHGERADVILLHGLAQLQVFRIFHVKKAGAAPDHEYLSDFLFQGQFVQSLLGPFVAGGALMNRTRPLIFVLGRRCRGEHESQQYEGECAMHAETIAEMAGVSVLAGSSAFIREDPRLVKFPSWPRLRAESAHRPRSLAASGPPAHGETRSSGAWHSSGELVERLAALAHV
jgi:hypothetical protein